MVLAEKIVYMPAGVDYRNFKVAIINSPQYLKCIEELDFAILAGDKEFAPAVKLILREAMELINSQKNYTPESYRAVCNALSSTYTSLLHMETKNAIATELQKRFNRYYSSDLLGFLQDGNMTTSNLPYEFVFSAGNITKNTYFLFKRMFDIIAAVSLVVILAPLFLLLMLLIKLDSPGPIFFVQKRMGAKRIRGAGMTVWKPVEFNFYKFRSMYHNADEAVHKEYIEKWMQGKLEAIQTDGGKFKMTQDPRITRIGQFIRKTSMDELPQLFNVIKGDMSLVGPRPVPLYEAAAYKSNQRERLASVPGITGWWQIKGRGRTTLDEQVEMDVEYIKQQSILLDIFILFNTPYTVIKGEGAH